eukprot:403355775
MESNIQSQQSNLRSIEGEVMLRRKKIWVKRYAKVENQIFSYKKDKTNQATRSFIDLRTAQVKVLMGTSDSERMIHLVQPSGISLYLALSSLREFDYWLTVLRNNQGSNLGGSQVSQNQGSGIQTQKSNQRKYSSESYALTSNAARTQKVTTGTSKFKADALESDQLKLAKQRIETYQNKNWFLVDGKDSCMAYTAGKRVPMSSKDKLIEAVHHCDIERIRETIVNKHYTLALLTYFTILIALDFLPMLPFQIDIPPKIIIAVKLVVAFGFLTVLAQILMQIRRKQEPSSLENKLQMSESFEIKCVINVTATPDEIAQALIDEKQRNMWDLDALKVTRTPATSYQKEEIIKVDYANGIVEILKFSFIQMEGKFYIQESVNSDFFRYYLLETVENRLFMMRVTMFGKVTPTQFERNGKESYRKISNLKTFISQLNRSSAVQVQIPKVTDSSNQLIVNMGQGQNTVFNNFIQDESESEDEGSGNKSSNQLFNQKTAVSQYSRSSNAIKVEKAQSFNNDNIQVDNKALTQSDIMNQGMVQSEILEEELTFNDKFEPYGRVEKVEVITDWESRKKLYKPQNLKYVDQISGFYDKYVAALDLPDWKICVDDNKNGLKVWQRNQGGLKAMKAEAIIDRCPDEVFRIIGDLSLRKEYDDTYDDGYALDLIAHQTFIQYQKTKKVAVVSARDFVYILSVNKVQQKLLNSFIIQRPDGIIYAMVNSTTREDLKPPEKSVVRGELDLGGWRLVPLPDNPNRTLCQFQALMDLKGSIPGFVLTQVNKDLGQQIVKLRKVVDKFYSSGQR